VVVVVVGGGRFTTGVTGTVVDDLDGFFVGGMGIGWVEVRTAVGVWVFAPPAPCAEPVPPPNGVDEAKDPGGAPARGPPPALAALPPEPPAAPPEPADPGLPGSVGTFGTVKGRDAAWMLGDVRCPEPTTNPATISRNAAAIALVAATTRSYGRRGPAFCWTVRTAPAAAATSAAGCPKSRDVKTSSRVR
jgi:hypothetical protein